MTKKIFTSIFTVASLIFLTSLIIIVGVLYDYFSDLTMNQLKTHAELMAQSTEYEGTAYLENLTVDNIRITYIDANGNVLFDNLADASTLENHSDREEVIDALANGFGECERYSSTFSEKTYYYAIRLNNGCVLRAATTQNSVYSLLIGMLQPLFVIFALALVVSAVLSSQVAKRIVKPLNEVDVENPMARDNYPELTPLLTRIENQQHEINYRINTLRQKQSEFNSITANLEEGLLLLNNDMCVVSINASACRILSIDGTECLGRGISELLAGSLLPDMAAAAKQDGRKEATADFNGYDCHIIINPVKNNDIIDGVAILILDVTDKLRADDLRREFTANVSHELKTPLHSISGCAELMKNDMVKPGDMKHFAEQIYSESQRLITLVNDIIRLSNLDEGIGVPQIETMNLKEIAVDVLEQLSTYANEHEISATLDADDILLDCVPGLVSEMLYNLIDNAIKYNRPGGSVKVGIHRENDGAVISVADTGIGIPPEYRERVFERFFRVDKSHSKKTGGTGLGLSIVKHAAKLHGAVIDVSETIGGGTTIELHFPGGNKNI